jgi:hypothetical protein
VFSGEYRVRPAPLSDQPRHRFGHIVCSQALIHNDL